MSYILDALRKVERQRAAGAPGISTVHSTTQTPRFRLAPLMYFAVSLAAVVALAWILRPAPRVSVPVAAVRATPERVEPPRASKSGSATQNRPARDTTITSKIAPHRDEATAPRARAEEARAVATPPSPAARAVERALPSAPAVRPVVPTPSAPAGRPVVPTPSAPAGRAVVPTPSAPAGRAVAPPTAPVPDADVRAPAPAPAPRVANTPAPTSPQLQGMKLEVLVYSDNPEDRIVFINGRKYVEGQTVDGGGLVERIDPDGVTLVFEGRRAVLRQ